MGKFFLKSVFSVFIIGVFLLQACNNETIKNKPVTINNGELVKYFRTADVDLRHFRDKIEIIVSDSKLIEEETQKASYKWTNWEPFASYGAWIFEKQLDSIVKDSVVIVLRNPVQTERYVYAIKDLKSINKFAESCMAFSKFIGDREVLKAKNLLGKQITAKDKAPQLDKFLSILVSQGGVMKSELISFNITNKIAKLYINVYYKSGTAQTYIFIFFLGGDEKIEGIRTF